MKTNRLILYLFILLIASFLLAFMSGCVVNRNEDVVDTKQPLLTMNLAVVTASQEPNSVNNDDKINQVAVLIYDKEMLTPEKVIVSDLQPTNTWISGVIKVKPGEKRIYVLTNYKSGNLYKTNANKLLVTPVDQDWVAAFTAVTINEIETLNFEAKQSIASSLFMVGKLVQTIDSKTDQVKVSIPVHRLAGRVDIYITKDATLQTADVKLRQIKLNNQVISSILQFDESKSFMPTPPLKQAALNVFQNTPIESTLPAGGQIPTNSFAQIYSYENRRIQSNLTQEIEIITAVNGVDVIYKGVILTDILHNQILSVMARLGNKETMNISYNVLPWSYIPSLEVPGIAFNVLPLSNAEVAFNEEATYTLTFNKTAGSYAWAATLSNGLDFAFSNTGGAVSSGAVVPNTPYVIKVKPTKSWTGVTKRTELILMIDGVRADLASGVPSVTISQIQ